MVLQAKEGIKIIEPNDNLAGGYLKMAEKSIGTMNREKNYNLMFAVSACYYSMYYSLYSILMKIGIKCEIHSCTMEFMKIFLNDFYTQEDEKTIKKSFDSRIIAQYYVDKIIPKQDLDLIFSQAPLFLNKSKEILSKLNEDNINQIRNKLKNI